jgi:hypothetical protein
VHLQPRMKESCLSCGQRVHVGFKKNNTNLNNSNYCTESRNVHLQPRMKESFLSCCPHVHVGFKKNNTNYK